MIWIKTEAASLKCANNTELKRADNTVVGERSVHEGLSHLARVVEINKLWV